MNVITFSLGTEIARAGSREYKRMRAYAAALDSLDVIVLSPGERGRTITDGPLSIHTTGRSGRFGSMLAGCRIARRIARSHKPAQSILTVQDPFEMGLAGVVLGLARHITLHVQVHGDYFGNSNWRRESLRNRLRYYLGRFVIRKARCVRVVSTRVKRSLTALKVPSAHISVLPIHPDLTAFYPVAENGRSDEQCSFLFVGRLAREKNLPLLLSAFDEIAASRPHVSLTLVGKGPEESALKRQAGSLSSADRINFIPWTDHVATLMREHDVFTLTSNYEGYGLVLVEALASGLPVVTTDVGCAGDLIRDTVEGCVVTPGDRAGFAQALASLADDPALRQDMRARAHETIEPLRAYDIESYTRDWVAALSRCADGI